MNHGRHPTMTDAIYVIVMTTFFVLCGLYVIAWERI